MAAVIQVLFPANAVVGTARRGEPSAGDFHERPALVEALREKTLSVFAEALRQLFDHADDLLFELGEKADSDAERRRNFDTMRVLRLGRERVTLAFAEGFRDGFAEEGAGPGRADRAAPSELPALALQASEELEEKIALGNLAAKAEALHKNALYELELRLRAAIHDHGAMLSVQCLSPPRICAAFGSAIGGIETDFQIKLVVYKLLDRVVIQEFGQAYAVALTLLEEYGVGLPRRRPAATVQSLARTDLPLRIRRPSGEPSLSAAAQQMLHKYGLETAATPAATALGGLIQQVSTRGGWAGLQASTQRLSMAGRLVDELLAEPLLDEGRRQSIEGLRHAVYCSALTDPAFFTNTGNPLRQLLADLLGSAFDPAAGTGLPQGLEARLLAAAGEMPDVSAEVPGDDGLLRPIAPGEVQVFLQQLREEARQRRELALVRVRSEVRQEISQRTRNRRLPPPVLSLVRGGIGPLMAMRLLRSGRDSVPFHQAQDTLDGIFSSLEFTPPASPDVLHSREALMSTLVTALSDIGMQADRVESLLEGLREVYARLESVASTPADTAPTPPASESGTPVAERAAPEGNIAEASPDTAGAMAARLPVPGAAAETPETLPSVTVLELLSRVLRSESWYRVYDAGRDQTRWLKLESFYPQQDGIVFSGFDESLRLSLHATRFAVDLALGHSEPINPDAAAREALEQLRAAKQRGVF